MIGCTLITFLLVSRVSGAEKPAIDFARDIQPILQQSCLKCHARGKYKGGLSLESRMATVQGGESGTAIVPGASGESLLIERIATDDPDLAMPQSGGRLTPEQIALLRSWIDQGAPWPDEINFGFPRALLEPRLPQLPATSANVAFENPIDRILQPSLAGQGVQLDESVPDRIFARRIYLDLIGLLPTPDELATFEQDQQPDKRERLVASVLGNRRAYAEHWLSFWNDALRNEYRGAGFNHGGRKGITGWLYRALYENKPYDQFVHELVSPDADSEGFSKGIVWKSAISASQTPAVQAAQNISQVFLATNLKCASCHDSFVNAWKLSDAYALANVFADSPLEIHRCEKPTGEVSRIAFLYPELGSIDAKLLKRERMKQLADLLVKRENGRLARTIVNRLWAVLFGRGIVDPVDDMDQPPWNRDLLDWLASDLAEHHFDLKHTLTIISTSRAYQLPSVSGPTPEADKYRFLGPQTKRMTAEQFIDAVATLTASWQPVTPDMLVLDARGQGGQIAAIAAVDGQREKVRASLLCEDSLSRALGRPSRDQVVTRRESVATTLQAIELTNGATLDALLKRGAEYWTEQCGGNRAILVEQVYQTAFGRSPTETETTICESLVGENPAKAEIQDFLWAIVMLPEFQLID